MTFEEAAQFQRDDLGLKFVEFRVITIPEEWPRVFASSNG